MRTMELLLDEETTALLRELAGSRNRQSALVRRLIHAEASRRKATRIAELEAEAARLRSELAAQEEDE